MKDAAFLVLPGTTGSTCTMRKFSPGEPGTGHGNQFFEFP
jgi:hypothetical protein